MTIRLAVCLMRFFHRATGISRSPLTETVHGMIRRYSFVRKPGSETVVYGKLQIMYDRLQTLSTKTLLRCCPRYDQLHHIVHCGSRLKVAASVDQHGHVSLLPGWDCFRENNGDDLLGNNVGNRLNFPQQGINLRETLLLLVRKRQR